MTEANSTPNRICTCCKIAFPATLDFFHAYKRAPDGCRAVCRSCRAEDHAKNREQRLAPRRVHYQANKERLCEKVRGYYIENAEAQKEAARKRHERNRDSNIERMRNYRAANRDAINTKRRESSPAEFQSKYKVDPVFTLKHRTRALLRRTLRASRGGRRMGAILGYSIDELRAHLERQFTRGMSWERFFAGEIHIDHIVPVAHFNPAALDSPEFKACWALPNLRPSWAKDNLSKGKKILTLI